MWRVYNLRHTTVFTYSHANTPLGQSERAYYLSYFIKRDKTSVNASCIRQKLSVIIFCVCRHYFLMSDHSLVEKVDMIVAISSTATRGEENFEKAKGVLESIITEYGRERLHYGVIFFGKPPRTIVRLRDIFDSDIKLVDTISSLPRDKGRADLAEVCNVPQESHFLSLFDSAKIDKSIQ